MSKMPNVFTIPSHQTFVEALAAGILKQVGDSPEQLAQVIVLLPTRRACRTLREAFLRLSDGKPMLLPQMMPLGDVDEDDLALETSGSEHSLDLPPANTIFEQGFDDHSLQFTEITNVIHGWYAGISALWVDLHFS